MWSSRMIGRPGRRVARAGFRNFATKRMSIAGEGPPPPSRITLDAVPKALRSFDKVLLLKAVVFDFGILTRIKQIAETEAVLVSGFDPRHMRHACFATNTGPVHGAESWIDKMDHTNVNASLNKRGLETSGTVEEQRIRLEKEVRRVNKKWVMGFL